MNYRELLELSKKYPNPFSLNQPKIHHNAYALKTKMQDKVRKEEETIVNQVKEDPLNVEAKRVTEKMITKIHRNC
ncbi:MAG TPA: hypothetical protein GXX14_12380 [Clostridiaceae bacterium]|nr:hypothetical protein [Clostridiaceae bacterium]